MKVFCVLAFCVVTNLIPGIAIAGSGGFTVRGGGDDIGLEFGGAFGAALMEIRQNQPDLQKRIEPLQLDSMLGSVKIFVTDEELPTSTNVGMQFSVAVNDPSKQEVTIQRKRWSAILQPRVKEAIALHEMLSLKELESTGSYTISGAFLGKFHLRNDPTVFATGQDPDLPRWKGRSLSCDLRQTVKDLVTGKEIVSSSSALHLQMSWSFGHISYFLDFAFATDQKNHRASTPRLHQYTQKYIRTHDKGIIVKTIGKQLSWRDGEVEEACDQGSFHYLEIDGLSKYSSYEWANGETGALEGVYSSSDLPDGGAFAVVTEPITTPVAPQGIGQPYNLESECVSRAEVESNWLDIVGQSALGAEIEKLNARALLLYAARRDFQSCTSGCESFAEKVTESQTKFEMAWNNIYDWEKSQLR